MTLSTLIQQEVEVAYLELLHKALLSVKQPLVRVYKRAFFSTGIFTTKIRSKLASNLLMLYVCSRLFQKCNVNADIEIINIFFLF